MTMRKKEIVRREVLRMMSMGESKTFYVGDARGIESARVTCVRAGYIHKCKYTVSADIASCCVTITKKLPI